MLRLPCGANPDYRMFQRAYRLELRGAATLVHYALIKVKKNIDKVAVLWECMLVVSLVLDHLTVRRLLP